MIAENTQDRAREYIQQGWAPIPIPAGSKAPVLKGWSQLSIASNNVEEYFDTGSNIGVLLGDNSAGLVDVDLDCREAVLAAEILLPATRVFGHADNPASHYLYMAAGTKSCTYDDPRSKRSVLIELRSTGKQTVFPGSVHTSGNRINFVNKRKIGTLTPARLQVLAGQVAAAGLLGMVMDDWDTGRHNAYLALTGAVLHGGLSPRDTRNFMQAVVNASGDDEPADRRRVIEDTIKRYQDGGEVTGWPTLEGVFDNTVLDAVRNWLQLTVTMPKLTLGGKPIGSITTSATIEIEDPPATDTPAEPEPLLREIEPGEPYPVDALGDVLAPMAQAMHDIIRAPAGICAQSVLGTAALVAQAHADVVMDDFRYPLSLYMLSIALTGERKSTADVAAMKPINDWQLARKDSHGSDVAQYKVELSAWEAVHDAGLKAAAEGDKDEATRLLTAAGLQPMPPASPIMLMHEPTYEGIVRHLEINWPSAGLYSDEGGRFLGGYAMATTNMLHTAAGLSEVWDGKAISRVRAQETKLLFGRRVSMHLMVQPGVATLLMGNDELADQGLLSRILVTHPESLIGSRALTDMNLSTMPATKTYYDAIQVLLDQRPTVSDKDPHQLITAPVKIDGRARTLLRAFYSHTEPLQAPGQCLAPIAGLASKGMQQVMRIAGVLTLVEKPGATKVPAHAIDAAIVLVEHYLSEALRLRSVSKGAPELVKAQKLLEWAQRQPGDVEVDGAEMRAVHAKQIYQYGPESIRDKDTALELAEILESHGWFIRLPAGASIDGTRRQLAWQVMGGAA